MMAACARIATMTTAAIAVLMISPVNSRPSIGCAISLHLKDATKLAIIKWIAYESFSRIIHRYSAVHVGHSSISYRESSLNTDKVDVNETLCKNPGLLSDAQRAAWVKVGRLLREFVRGPGSEKRVHLY
jgi:hypothetical protein